jgi:hypothetical protein
LQCSQVTAALIASLGMQGIMSVGRANLWMNWSCYQVDIILSEIGKVICRSLLLYKSNWIYIGYICIIALIYRSWVKTLAAYTPLPCPINMPGILF